ncbi:proteasome assembly chaperone family protein [Humidisolicoccus flavus]|uniref:proteasome assembly chaperone family protein n=1 Tax=Humidisolicoccus flavus TaxID=3111414 RepID=UPI0032544BFB
MRDPLELVSIQYDANPEKGLPLVIALHGFADAAGVTQSFGDSLRANDSSDVVARFDTDELIDMRSRRPTVLFVEDHVESIQRHELNVERRVDDLGRPFLLLAGPEPDYQWDRFTAAVVEVAERFQVGQTIIFDAIPMPVPHTRPVGVTVSGTRKDLVEAYSVWKPTSTVPAAALHFLEDGLIRSGASVATFIVLVPHYLGDSGGAAPTIAALENLTNATGLVFPTEELREQQREFQQLVAEQLDTNEELRTLLDNLESRYDAYMADSKVRSPLVDEDGGIPSADELAAELERFLRRDRGDRGER